MTTLIVSAFFKIPSKKPYIFYYEQLSRWFRSIRAPVLFFTTPDVWVDILAMGYNLSHVQFIFLSLEDCRGWEWGREFWERQLRHDPEKYHTPELAVMWYEKKEFVRRAMEIRHADILIWCDAGCIRNDRLEQQGKDFGLREHPLLNNGTLHVQYIREQPYRPTYSYPEYRFACGIMAGNQAAWNTYHDLYRHMLVEYDFQGVSCNSDQYITASCYDLYPDGFTCHYPDENHPDPWCVLLGAI